MNARSRHNGVSCQAGHRSPAVHCTTTETSVEALQKEFGAQPVQEQLQWSYLWINCVHDTVS